jgi:hypothetical protein
VVIHCTVTSYDRPICMVVWNMLTYFFRSIRNTPKPFVGVCFSSRLVLLCWCILTDMSRHVPEPRKITSDTSQGQVLLNPLTTVRQSKRVIDIRNKDPEQCFSKKALAGFTKLSS